MQSTNQASNEEDGYDHLHALKKVEVLLQKAKEAAEKRENTLAHAFSEKVKMKSIHLSFHLSRW